MYIIIAHNSNERELSDLEIFCKKTSAVPSYLHSTNDSSKNVTAA